MTAAICRWGDCRTVLLDGEETLCATHWVMHHKMPKRQAPTAEEERRYRRPK